MGKDKIPFSDFVTAAGEKHSTFIRWVDEYMLAHDCTCEIKESKSGYLVSYLYTPTKRTIINYVFRKKGLVLRVYADGVANYMATLDQWPDSMKTAVKKAGPCKRMLDPGACNSRCVMGFDFIMDGQREQKCRYGGFMFLLDEETKPVLKDMLQNEMQTRGSVA